MLERSALSDGLSTQSNISFNKSEPQLQSHTEVSGSAAAKYYTVHTAPDQVTLSKNPMGAAGSTHSGLRP